MREWLLLGVLALGGILGIWLLIFKSLAALYELWQSGREFDRLKRDAASRRMQRPSELMQRKQPALPDDDSSMPVIPQALLDSLSDEQADPRLVPQKGSAPPAHQQEPSTADDLLTAEPTAESPQESAPAERPQAEQMDSSTTSTPPPPTFPLPPASNESADDTSDELILDSEQERSIDDENSPVDDPADDASGQPPRHDR
jgi:hypothetical protein